MNQLSDLSRDLALNFSFYKLEQPLAVSVLLFEGYRSVFLDQEIIFSGLCNQKPTRARLISCKAP